LCQGKGEKKSEIGQKKGKKRGGKHEAPAERGKNSPPRAEVRGEKKKRNSVLLREDKEVISPKIPRPREGIVRRKGRKKGHSRIRKIGKAQAISPAPGGKGKAAMHRPRHDDESLARKRGEGLRRESREKERKNKGPSEAR